MQKRKTRLKSREQTGGCQYKLKCPILHQRFAIQGDLRSKILTLPIRGTLGVMGNKKQKGIIPKYLIF